jgi:hypothetical protein
MSEQEAREFAMLLVKAGKRGDPMPSPLPAGCPEVAAKSCYELGRHYAELDALKR